MERGKEKEGEREKREANNTSVSAVLGKDIAILLDFIERLKNGRDQIGPDMDEIEKLALELTVISACLHLCYFNSDGFEAEICSISYEVHDLVQPLFDHQSGDDMVVKLKNHFVPCVLQYIKSFISSPSHHHPQSIATITEDQLVELLDALLVNLHCLYKCRSELIFPSMTLYELLQTVCGNLRDFHGLKINGCIERKTIEDLLAQFLLVVERVGHFCFVLLADQLDVPQVNSMLAHLLVKITPVELEVMHICSTNLKASKSAEVGRFIKKHMEASPIILREYLIHLHEHMVNVISASTSARNIHVVIEFLLIILTDVPEDFIHHDELFVLLEHVRALTREVSILVCSLEESSRNGENMNATRNASLNLLENIELLKGDLKHVFLKGPVDLSQLHFPMSDGPLFMSLLLRNLNDLLNSNAYSVALIKEEIGLVKENLEFIRSFFGNDEQELNRDLWDRILDVAYKVELTIKSILVRDHGLVHLIFLLPDIVEKINLIKEEVQEKIRKNKGLVANSPNKHVESKSSTRLIGQIIVGFEEETDWMIRKLTSGPAEIDVISIIGMPGLGKTTLAYKVYNDKLVVDHFDVRAWCTVDHERNVNKSLQKIFNQVIGLTERINEDDIDDDIADKLRKKLFGRRYLIVLDDLSDTATWDELTMPFPQVKKGSRVILTSRVKEMALHGKRHCDPLNLRFLRPEESWELLEKRIFGEEHCPYELLDVGKEIAQRCRGLPLVLDMIGGIIARKAKVKVFWLEVLNNLDSFTFKDKEEVVLHGKRHNEPLNLRLLRPEESWEFLEKRIFGEKNCPDELKDVGEEIARKCEGIPLMLDMIGGVITKIEKEKALWLEVLHNFKSYNFKNEEEDNKVVQLSYDHLPDHLKLCLLYLASYPKDTYFRISELTDLWSAQGVVEQTVMKSAEEATKVYLDELISSSLVIAFNVTGMDPSFQIHDRVHDFCLEKARKEKLFEFISSSAPSSSSDLMPRGMIIHYDQHDLHHSNKIFCLFNSEKENLHVKHLLSLKVNGKQSDLSNNGHLKHLRLLKSLELRCIRLTDSLLNEIGMLVHLRCLKIQTKAKALPRSFSNLWNLETLVVYNRRARMVLSPRIWSLAKLRHVSMNSCSIVGPDINESTVLAEDSKLENLRILYGLNLFYSKDKENIFKRFPNLRSLTFSIREPWPCSAEQICFPRLDVLNELEQVSAYFYCAWPRKHTHQCDFHFPSSLKKLKLARFNLTSDSLSGIARSLPNLQHMRLEETIIQGKEWNMEEDTFENLKVLTLYKVSLSEWRVGEESFPVLEELYILNCHDLMEIPDGFGDVWSLKSISLFGNPQLEESALNIKEYVAEMTGEDKLEVTSNW